MTVGRCALVVGAFTDGTIDQQPLMAAAPWTLRSSDIWDPGAASDNAPVGSRSGDIVDPAFNYMFPDSTWLAAQMAFRGASTLAQPQPNEMFFNAGSGATFSVGACSRQLLLESTLGPVPVATSNGIDAVISSTGAAFFADPACSYSVKTLHIGAGTSTIGFYLRPTATGTQTLTATAPGLSAAMYMLIVN